MVFDVYVANDGATGALLQEGAMRVCGRTGRYTNLTEPCQFARIDPNGRVRRRARPDYLPFTGVSHGAVYPFDRSCAGTGISPFENIFNNSNDGNGGGDGPQ